MTLQPSGSRENAHGHKRTLGSLVKAAGSEMIKLGWDSREKLGQLWVWRTRSKVWTQPLLGQGQICINLPGDWEK